MEINQTNKKSPIHERAEQEMNKITSLLGLDPNSVKLIDDDLRMPDQLKEDLLDSLCLLNGKLMAIVAKISKAKTKFVLRLDQLISAYKNVCQNEHEKLSEMEELIYSTYDLIKRVPENKKLRHKNK